MGGFRVSNSSRSQAVNAAPIWLQMLLVSCDVIQGESNAKATVRQHLEWLLIGGLGVHNLLLKKTARLSSWSVCLRLARERLALLRNPQKPNIRKEALLTKLGCVAGLYIKMIVHNVRRNQLALSDAPANTSLEQCDVLACFALWDSKQCTVPTQDQLKTNVKVIQAIVRLMMLNYQAVVTGHCKLPVDKHHRNDAIAEELMRVSFECEADAHRPELSDWTNYHDWLMDDWPRLTTSLRGKLLGKYESRQLRAMRRQLGASTAQSNEARQTRSGRAADSTGEMPQQPPVQVHAHQAQHEQAAGVAGLHAEAGAVEAKLVEVAAEAKETVEVQLPLAEDANARKRSTAHGAPAAKRPKPAAAAPRRSNRPQLQPRPSIILGSSSIGSARASDLIESSRTHWHESTRVVLVPGRGKGEVFLRDGKQDECHFVCYLQQLDATAVRLYCLENCITADRGVFIESKGREVYVPQPDDGPRDNTYLGVNHENRRSKGNNLSPLIGRQPGSDLVGFYFYLNRDVKAGQEAAWDYNEISSASTKSVQEAEGTNTLGTPDGETLQARRNILRARPGEAIVLPDGRTNMQMHGHVTQRQAHLRAQFKGTADERWLENLENQCKRTMELAKQFRAAQARLLEFEVYLGSCLDEDSNEIVDRNLLDQMLIEYRRINSIG